MVVPGSLESVEVEHFMTFTYAVFRPGQGFNVILGPNGSGKSSLVSAINLGLGGPFQILGRQHNLGEFINNDIPGAKEAKIRIQLFKNASGSQLHVIDCSIRKTGGKDDYATFFKIDGQDVSAAAVRTLATELQIQTDNMCQFLPQDVVRKFPEMTPQEIFVHTIRYT